MLIATLLPRVFSFRNNGEDLKLPDPDPNWSAEAVLNHYMPLYPILATATINKPVIENDTQLVKFSSTIGTKG